MCVHVNPRKGFGQVDLLFFLIFMHNFMLLLSFSIATWSLASSKIILLLSFKNGEFQNLPWRLDSGPCCVWWWWRYIFFRWCWLRCCVRLPLFSLVWVPGYIEGRLLISLLVYLKMEFGLSGSDYPESVTLSWNKSLEYNLKAILTE